MRDKLKDLIEAKADMKAAIESKGVTVTGGLSTYADAINSISNFKVTVPINTKFTYSLFEEAPYIDTSQWTDMSKMFYWCYKLRFVPAYDTSNVTDMSNMFWGADSTLELPLFDCGNVVDVTGMLRTLRHDSTLKGFKDLGKQRNIYGIQSLFRNVLDRSSIINIFNNLYDRRAAGYAQSMHIEIDSNVLKDLTTEQITIATNKGWTIHEY